MERPRRERGQARVGESSGPLDVAGLRPPHTVGYWNKPGSRRAEDWVGVVTPQDYPESVVYPKERALIDICKRQKAEGYQTWVFVQMTGKRNIQPRLAKLLEAEGLRVGVLRSTDVDPKEREDWIAAHGRDFDVMISHPQLVSTGLDLFSKAEGGHNFATIVFYETGYNLFTMRQAARRAWRIGQPKNCRIYYLYYRETMQHRAMQLMSRKMAATQALEGEFSEDGLAAMAGEDNLQMALAKSIARTIDDADMQRSWTKVKGGPKKPRRPTVGIEALAPRPIRLSPLDGLPPAVQLVAETLIDGQHETVPENSVFDVEWVRAEIAKLDRALDAASAYMFEEPEADVVESEPYKHEAPATKAIRVFQPDEEDTDMPILTEEILARMFNNMMAAGLT